jgi:hypothetical protein
MIRVIISTDGTMINADYARIVTVSTDKSEELLELSDSERWEYAKQNGMAI